MISSDELRGEIKKQLDIRRWNYNDLGKATVFSPDRVRVYMSDNHKQSDRFERRVCWALGIKRS